MSAWDAKYRGAMFTKEYATALSIAQDRIARRSLQDVDTILNTNACYVAPADFSVAIEAAIRRAFPSDESLQLRALSDVAQSLGATAEGIAAGERVVAGWERIGTRRDIEDSWPKHEDAANIARGRLRGLYERAGRTDDAERVFPFELCRHLRPIQRYLVERGVSGRYRFAERMQLVYSVEAVLDVDAIAAKLALAPEVRSVDYFDRRAAYTDLGFECSVHRMWILGIHYEELSPLDPRRLRSNWVS